MAFHFPLMPRIYMALRQEDRLPITDIMVQTPEIPDNCQWGLFLRNHDELTLEMVTADERDYMYLAYSADPRMRINVGIRRRLAPLVDNNRRRIELLNSLLLSFPGTPIIYYGDEIGMGDNIYLGDRNGVRTPMQWNSDRNAGFSKCDPARLYFPVVMDPIYGYQAINVEAQLSDQSSLLHWTRNMIALRKLFPVFGRGKMVFLNPANRKILAYLRDLHRGDDSHETVLCVANLSRFAQPASLDLSEYAGFQPVEMLGYVPFPMIDGTPYALTLAPYSFLWLELQPANAIPELRPESVRLTQGAETDEIAAGETIADYLVRDGWSSLVSGKGLQLLGTALQAWLPRQRWFGAKARRIQHVRVLDWVELGVGNAGSAIPPALLFVQVDYGEGLPDTYQLPLAFSDGADAEGLIASNPQAVVASFATLSGPAVVYDATTREDFRYGLLKLIEQSVTLPLSSTRGAAPEVQFSPGPDEAGGYLDARASAALTTLYGSPRLGSRIAKGEQSNTSILYGRQLILKLFRRLQPGENPDVEIGRYLTEVARFPRIAPLLGEINILPANGERTTIAMLQALVANNGDGWQWFLVQLERFFGTVAALPAPLQSAMPSFVGEQQLNGESLAYAGLDAAALLGQRTAEMHLALAAATDDPAFVAEPLTTEDLAADARRIESQITATLAAIKTRFSTLDDLTADDAGLLLSRRIELIARANSITAFVPTGQRFRIHGDYHLGQTLRTVESDPRSGLDPGNSVSGDFVLLDFEGEPARSLAERRQKQSPLRDVAGMIRSFSYAAFTGLDRYIASQPEGAPIHDAVTLGAWATLWQNAASSHFLRAYRETISANPAILPDPQQAQALLEAYLLEKALYETLYELNNRPAWVRIPLAGILSL